MAALSSEDFRNAIRSRYEMAVTLASPLEISIQFDDPLRGIVARIWEKVQLLQALTLQVSTGDPATAQLIFRGELEQIVEAWQRAILSIPRATLAPSDPEFRDRVIARYNSPSDMFSIDKLGDSLDGELANWYFAFWALRYQLYICVENLVETKDPDMAELTKRNLKHLVEVWKKAILNRPRVNVNSTGLSNSKGDGAL